MWRYLLQLWLREAAERKLSEAVANVIQSDSKTDHSPGGGCDSSTEQAQQPEINAPDQANQSVAHQFWDVACIFALSEESGGLEDLCSVKAAKIRGEGFAVRIGEHRGRRIGIVISGVGRTAAARATAAVIEAHRPQLVITAGFAGALDPELRRNDLVVADTIAREDGKTIRPETVDDLRWPRCFVGRLLTVDRVVKNRDEKQELRKVSQALAVEMESYAVVEACCAAKVPVAAIRVILDTADENLPPHLEVIAKQKTPAARWGAAIGALLNRPSSVADFYKLKENALTASDRLAKFLTELISRRTQTN